MYQHITAIVLLSESQTQTHVVTDAFHVWNTERICELDKRIRQELRFRGTDGQNKRTYGRHWSNNHTQLTLEIELVAVVSGFRNGTLVNISLPVSAVTAPWSADQEPAENSMSSSGKQLWGGRHGHWQNR